MNKKLKVAAIILLFKEQDFIGPCVRAIYPLVDAIICVTSYDRNFIGQPVPIDESISTLLSLPDQDNKIKLAVMRDLQGIKGKNSEAKLRNTAMSLAPHVDYYMIVDSDEIWTKDAFDQALNYIERTRHAAYRVSSWTYFKKWNYRCIEPGHGYRPLVFLKKGFFFLEDRQVNWFGWSRWKEYLRTGRKPRTSYFPPEIRLHHGSSVGDDNRIETKLKNYGHADLVDPTWFDRVWKKFTPDMKNFHYFKGTGHLLESVDVIPTDKLPDEVRSQQWPDGWINRD